MVVSSSLLELQLLAIGRSERRLVPPLPSRPLPMRELINGCSSLYLGSIDLFWSIRRTRAGSTRELHSWFIYIHTKLSAPTGDCIFIRSTLLYSSIYGPSFKRTVKASIVYARCLATDQSRGA